MSRLLITETAERELDDIWVYIAGDNPVAADGFIDKLLEKMHIVADTPKLGVVRHDLGSELRMFPVDRYVIIYRQIVGGIEIIHVSQGARDFMALMS